MSGFRPANKKFDQLRKGPGAPRGASKNVLRAPPVRSLFNHARKFASKGARQGRRAPGEASKTLGKALEGSSKASRNAFLGSFTHRSNAKIYVSYIYIYIYTYTHTRLNTAIRLSAYPSSGLPSYRLTVLPSCRLIVSTSCRLSALPPHTLTISPYYHLNVFCLTVLQFYRVACLPFCRFAVLPPCCLTALMSYRPAILLIQPFTVFLP